LSGYRGSKCQARKNVLCPLFHMENLLRLLCYSIKVDTHKSYKWFSGHYFRIEEMVGISIFLHSVRIARSVKMNEKLIDDKPTNKAYKQRVADSGDLSCCLLRQFTTGFIPFSFLFAFILDCLPRHKENKNQLRSLM